MPPTGPAGAVVQPDPSGPETPTDHRVGIVLRRDVVGLETLGHRDAAARPIDVPRG